MLLMLHIHHIQSYFFHFYLHKNSPWVLGAHNLLIVLPSFCCWQFSAGLYWTNDLRLRRSDHQLRLLQQTILIRKEIRIFSKSSEIVQNIFTGQS